MERVYRISAIIPRGNDFYFVSYDGGDFVLKLENPTVWLPNISKDIPWRLPILRITEDKKGSREITLDNRIIYTDKEVSITALDEFIRSFPENNNLEEDINSLPLLWRIGLKMLLYMRYTKLEDRQYMSFLIWINQQMVNYQKRYKIALKKSVSVNVASISEQECLKILGVKCLEVLKENEKEVIGILTSYMLRTYRNILQDYKTVWRDVPFQQYIQNHALTSYMQIDEKFLVYHKLSAYMHQDISGKQQTIEDMLNFEKKYSF